MIEGGFLGTPGVGLGLFAGLTAASFLTNYLSIVTGTAGGLMLLVIMASFFPPAVLVPLHTLIQLGSGTSRAFTMRAHILTSVLMPFAIGCTLGAAIGAQLFVSLPEALLMTVLAVFVLIVTWIPRIGQFGPERGRFALLGFGVTLLGVFVSATGTLVGAFVAGASPTRHNHVSTMSALMAITHLAKMAAFLWVGVALGAYLPLVGAMIGAGVLGNAAGEHSLARMQEDWFRLVFKVVMTLLAARLLWLAARAAGLV